MLKLRNSSKIGSSSKQDIRSYFTKTKPEKEKPAAVVLSDEDVIPESPDVQVKAKKKESRKKRVLNDSSDEEIFKKKPKRSDETSKDKVKNKKPDKAPKEVNPVDLFGSGPIKRTEPIVKKVKKVKTETGIHSDDEFEKSLLELDAEKTEPNDLIKNNINHVLDKPSEVKILESSKQTNKKSEVSPEKQSKYFTESSSKKSSTKGKQLETDDCNKNHENPVKSKTDTELKVKEEKDTKNDSKSKNKSPNKPSNKTPEKQTKTSKSNNKNKPIGQIEIIKNEKKRPFAEFINDDAGNTEAEQSLGSEGKKKKLDTSFNTSVVSDEERHEKKRHSAILYQNYMNRSGPKHLGSKEMPEASPDCLKDCAFLLTGVLDSFERDEVAETITKYGGTVKSGVSKKVTHVIAGDDAGPAKIAKAKDLGIPIMNEDQFIQMLIDKSKPKSTEKQKHKQGSLELKKEISSHKVEKVTKKDDENKCDGNLQDRLPTEDSGNSKSSNKNKKVSLEQMKKFEDKIKGSFYSKSKKEDIETKNCDNVDVKIEKTSSSSIVSVKSSEGSKSSSSASSMLPDAGSMMWVEKYKPRTLKQIIGQNGDASNVKKLTNWLSRWYISRKEKIAKPSPWAKNDDGAYFKAALLSGPPGVGKTTTVSLVCQELGFDTVELNASDTRSKTLVRDQVRELLNTTSLAGYAKGDTGKMAVSKKHVLVMDEVDGMAGNEDRGGLQELIALIKTTSVPIICMCNDRNSEKMRSLVNYCFDLKFSRPRVDQIKSAMMSVCFKEGIKVPPDVLTQLIVASNQDVRQTLNSLSLWAADPSNMDADRLKKDVNMTKKDVKMGAWEAVRKAFSAQEHAHMSLGDKSDLFFTDYSIMPLFMQENYLSVTPHCDKDEIKVRVSRAADSISFGDLVDARIRGSQAWSLLPLQAMYSTVIPGTSMSGHVSGQIQFPGWLGKNSRHSKMKRLAMEIHAHTRLSATGSKSSIFLDYSRHLRDAIITPLIKDRSEGIERSLEVLQAYNLLREDLDSLNELATWPRQQDPLTLVDSKVKAAMTRAYNKAAPALPHAGASFSKARGKVADSDLYGDDDEQDQLDDDVDDGLENDALIKVKKTKSTSSAASDTNSDKPSTSKGKKGKGKK